MYEDQSSTYQKLSLNVRPSKIKPKFQIVVPINEITVNVTTFMRFTPAGMVINTRNTGMKRQINTAHTPYF